MHVGWHVGMHAGTACMLAYWHCTHMGITFTRASTWSPVRCKQLRVRCVTPGRLGSNCPRASPVTPLHWLTPRDRKLVILLSACTQATDCHLPEECHSCLTVCKHGVLPKACHVHIIVVLTGQWQLCSCSTECGLSCPHCHMSHEIVTTQWLASCHPV